MGSIPLKLQTGRFDVVVDYEAPSLRALSSRQLTITPNERELFFGDHSYQFSSRHRISIMCEDAIVATCVLCATGGASVVHAHSALVRGGVCFVAIGAFICALNIPNLEFLWQAEVDTATCFGVYDAPAFKSIISHGECEIVRLSYDGNVIWSSAGRDIFTEGFTLFDEHIEVIDFEGTRYQIDVLSGDIRLDPA